MNNRGVVTVFLTLLLSGLVMLFTAIYAWIGYQSAKARENIAFRTAMSGVRAEYHRYIFDRYHVLLLDGDMDGEGSGKLEALAEKSLQENLGDDFVVSEVRLNAATRLMEDDLQPFKRQVEQAIPYLAADYGVDYLKDKLGENIAPLQEENFAEADEATEGGRYDGDGDLDGISGTGTGTGGDPAGEDASGSNSFGSSDLSSAGSEEDSGEAEEYDDPRLMTSLYQGLGIAYFIAPEDMEVSSEVLNRMQLPSFGNTGVIRFDVDAQFSSYRKLRSDSLETSSMLRDLATGGEGLIYAASCFNCLTDEVQEDTVLRLEMEYLIAGESTDRDNYKTVVDKITAIRTACNLACILMDAEKMEICYATATAACWFFPPIIPVVKYLIAGAWSYIEAVADAYRLVRGKKVPYVKTAENWLTDLDGMGRLAETTADAPEDESGLDYKDYLMILMAMNMDSAFYRMLDIIQVNANRNVEDGGHTIDLRLAVTALGMGVDIIYDGKKRYIVGEIGF